MKKNFLVETSKHPFHRCTGWVDPDNKCKRCEAAMPLPKYEDKNCPGCGVSHEEAMSATPIRKRPYCAKCDMVGDIGDKFCGMCGKQFGS